MRASSNLAAAAAWIMAFSSFPRTVLGQPCACNPLTFTLRLRLGLGCPTPRSDATVSASVCQPEGATDLTPVLITDVRFFELDRNLRAFGGKAVENVSLGEGDLFSYTSVITTFNASTLVAPRGYQVTFMGVNSMAQAISLSSIFLFTNTCGEFPVFTVNEVWGWSEIAAVSSPNNLFCGIPTPAPTASPTTASPTTASPSTPSPTTPKPRQKPTSGKKKSGKKRLAMGKKRSGKKPVRGGKQKRMRAPGVPPPPYHYYHP